MPLLRAEFRRYARLLNPLLFHDPSQVLYLPFDRDDGAYARDRSSHGNHGTIYGAIKAAGKIGGALNFDGINDYVEVADASSLKPSSFAIMCWYYRLGAGDTGIDLGIMTKFDPALNRGFLLAEDKGTDRIWFRVMGANNWGGRVLSAYNNIWTHLCLTFDGNTAIYYENGGSPSGIIAGAITHSDLPLLIGKYQPAYGGFVNAIIDEIRVYNRALSQAEIVRVMNLRGT